MSYRAELKTPQTQPAPGWNANTSSGCNGASCADPTWRGFDQTRAGCNAGESVRNRCTWADVTMCPSTVPGSQHNTGYHPDTGIRNAKPIGALASDPTSAAWTTQAFGRITCIYAQPPVKTLQQLKDWKDNFKIEGGTDGETYQRIMQDFCSQAGPSGQCSIDPVTGQKMTTCNMLTSTSEEGVICRAWATGNPQLADTAKVNYCVSNTTSPDCQCLARANDPIYKRITASGEVLPILDRCWWRPCQDPNTYLVTDAINKSGTCPANICQTISKFADSTVTGDVKISQKISCQFPKPDSGGGGADGGGGGGSGGGGRGSDPDDPPPKKKNLTWLWILLGVFGALMIGAVVYAVTRKKKLATPVAMVTPAEVTPLVRPSAVVTTIPVAVVRP
jgi:hypothetical protein